MQLLNVKCSKERRRKMKKEDNLLTLLKTEIDNGKIKVVAVRPEIAALAKLMQHAIDNQALVRGGDSWKEGSIRELNDYFNEKVNALQSALNANPRVYKEVTRCVVNATNAAMFINDVYGDRLNKD